MKKLLMKLSYAMILMLSLSSCTHILGDIIFPNQCIRCEVKDLTYTYWTYEECGGGKDDLETRCKAKAYDVNEFGGTAKCNCEYYTQSKMD